MEDDFAGSAGKLPGSDHPWRPGADTCIAARGLGREGASSWLQSAELPNRNTRRSVV
ncbi:MAG: hypothetical protein WA990_13155 [Rubrobacteraceae bacterium]